MDRRKNRAGDETQHDGDGESLRLDGPGGCRDAPTSVGDSEQPVGLIWYRDGRPARSRDGDQSWVVCLWVDENREAHYDCGLYDDEADTLVVDCEEFAFSTPFSEYLQWAYIEGTA